LGDFYASPSWTSLTWHMSGPCPAKAKATSGASANTTL